MTEILSIGAWRTNAEMIDDIRKLPGYLTPQEPGPCWSVLDATYGRGGFWKVWQPEVLTGSDLHEDPSITAEIVGVDLYEAYQWDYRAIPAEDNTYDVVVFDPPYKLNGTPALPDMDTRYGTNRRTTRAEVMEDIRVGATECYRVCRHRLFVKCMDQVEGGKKRWQTDMVTTAIEELGGRKMDRFDIPSAGIPQATVGRIQRTSRAKHSTLLTFEKRGPR